MKKYYIDYLRVVAILAVITNHVTAYFYNKFGKINQLEWWLSNLLNSTTRFSVPLFVMISGALLLGRPMSTGMFYSKRSSRLLPALVFWNLFYIGFNYYITRDANHLIWVISGGIFTTGNAFFHLWYLSMFMCLMLFAPFINKFINGDKPISNDLFVLLLVIFAFFLLNSLSSISREVLNINIDWFKVFPWYIAYFIGGYYIDRYSDKLKIKNCFILLYIVAITLIGAALNYCSATYLGIIRDSFVLSFTGPFIFVLASLVFLFARKNAAALKSNKFISTISEASFGIYLIHPMFLYILHNILFEYESAPFIYIPAVITVTGFISYLSIIFIRKIPLMRAVC